MATKIQPNLVNRVEEQFKSEKYKNQAFTNPVSKSLAESGDSKAMGRMGEMYIQNMLVDLGLKCKLLNGCDPYDLTMPNGQNIGRIEVKTAKVGYNTTVRKDGTRAKKYSFNQIKVECFDLIFFIFVDYEECVVRVGGKKAKNLIKRYGTTQAAENGLQIVFPENKRHCRERGQDDIFMDVTLANMKKLLKS